MPEIFPDLLETYKPALRALIAEDKLPFYQFAELICSKGKTAQTAFVRDYLQEHWDSYFKNNMHLIVVYLLELNNFEDINSFFQSLTLERQQYLMDFIATECQKNMCQEELIKFCKDWEEILYFTISFVRVWNRFPFDMPISLLDRLWRSNKPIGELCFLLLIDIPITSFVLALSLVLLTLTSIAFLTMGIIPAMVGLGFTLSRTIITSNLQQRNATYEDPQKITTLHTNLMFFQPTQHEKSGLEENIDTEFLSTLHAFV